MQRAYQGHAGAFAVIEISELALRFRETPQGIEDALLLLRGLGRAESVRPSGYWQVQLKGPLLGGRETPWQKYEQLCINPGGRKV